ncbi:MAG: hypothetical protein IKE74_10555 [Mogibacterium sp.]|nr:hypothetical protein [Mogibacterium sp.]
MNSNSKAAAVLSYITWLGFLIAVIMRDPTDRFTAHHMNQALVLNVIGFVAGALNIIPIIGNIAGLVIGVGVFVLEIMGIARAVSGSMEPLPFIGDFHWIG